MTLYELLTLEPALDGGDRREVLRRIIEEEPRPLRALNPSVPRELETIIQKATAKEPVVAYTTAQELADDLRRFLEYKPIHARPRACGIAQQDDPATQDGRDLGGLDAPDHRHRRRP